MDDLIKQTEDALNDFAKINELMETINPEKLPFALQLKMTATYIELTKAIEKFDEEMKGIIVAATILNRN